MSALIRRSSYLSMLGLSYQSYRSTQSMSAHLLQMTTHAQTSQSLTTQSTTDTTTANNLHTTSLTSKTQGEELENSANLLKKQADENKVEAIKDENDAEHLVNESNKEKDEMDVLESKIASEESLYETEFNKASAEGSEASSNTLNLESDGMATSMCEFVPFVDVLCDFVGSVAVVSSESNAAKLSAQSAVDYTTAASTKEQEDTDIAELNSLRTEIDENTDIASGLNSKSKEEELKSELQEANEERKEADEKMEESKKEETESEEEMSKAKEEEVKAEEEMDKAMQQGFEALKDAALAGLVSTLVLSFFAIRMFIAVAIPVGISVIGFIPSVMTMPNNYGTVDRPAIFVVFFGNAWTLLPKREVSYFMLHCVVFISTINIWFCSRFQNLDKFTIQSRGGILLAFAVVASCVQGFLLHALPHFITKMTGRWKHHKEQTEGYATSTSYPTSYPTIIGGTILKLFKAIVYLTPLFIIEITTLWLLFGRCILTFNLPSPFSAENIGVLLLLAGIIYIAAFEIEHPIISKQDGEEGYNGKNNKEEGEEDCIIVQKVTSYGENDDNDHGHKEPSLLILESTGGIIESTGGIINETQNLIHYDDINKYYHDHQDKTNCDLERVAVSDYEATSYMGYSEVQHLSSTSRVQRSNMSSRSPKNE